MSTYSWLHPHLEKRCSATQGCGVFATAGVKKGERVAIFGGKIMLIDDMYKMPAEMQHLPMQIEERFVLGPPGSVPEDTEFFNHSCCPNSGFKGQIFLVAMRDIRAGEEVTFDYAMTVSESVGSDMVFKMDCTCGSPLCRGTITEQDWMLPELQDRYRGYFSPYIQEKIERLNKNRIRDLVSSDEIIPADTGFPTNNPADR